MPETTKDTGTTSTGTTTVAPPPVAVVPVAAPAAPAAAGVRSSVTTRSAGPGAGPASTV